MFLFGLYLFVFNIFLYPTYAKTLILIYVKITILFTFTLFNTIHIMYNLVLSVEVNHTFFSENNHD